MSNNGGTASFSSLENNDTDGSVSGIAHPLDDAMQRLTTLNTSRIAAKTPSTPKNCNLTDSTSLSDLNAQLIKCSSISTTCLSPTANYTSAVNMDKLDTFDKLYSSFNGCTIKSCSEINEPQDLKHPEPKPPKISSIVKISERLSGFERGIQLQARKKIMAEEAKIKNIEQTIARLGQSVEGEASRRVETVKSLHSIFETQIKMVQQKIESVILSKFTHLEQVVNSINDKITKLEAHIENEKVRQEKYFKERAQSITQGITSLQALVEEDRIKRSQRETKILEMAVKAEAKVDSLLEDERNVIERKIEELKDKFETWKVNQEKEASEFQKLILNDLSTVKNGLVWECHAREGADDDIVQALHSYAKIFSNIELEGDKN